MAKYRLLAGQHVQSDKSKPIKGPDGKPTGRFEKQVFQAKPGAAGPIVESDVDLVAKLGANKFERVDAGVDESQGRVSDLEAQLAEARAENVRLRSAAGVHTPGDPTDENLLHSPAVAPGGQVSTGFQGSGGPLPPGHMERAGAGLFAAEGESAATGGRPQHTREELESLTINQLREIAAEEEIELSDARSREAIINDILAR